MTTPHGQARAAIDLLAATGTASLSVVAARLLALSDPSQLFSHAQQRELTRMVSEKFVAGCDGWCQASAELGVLPYRMLQATTRRSVLTPDGLLQAWATWGGLWLGVGNAALRPAKATVVRNQARLRRTRRA